jgi:hypothetical protein
MGIETQSREGELHHVGLADDDGAGLAQPPDDGGILLRRRRIAQGDRSRGRRLARDVEEVLDGDDSAIEGT